MHTTNTARATPPAAPHPDPSDALPPPHRERDDDQHKQPHKPPKRSPKHSKPLPLPPSTAPRPAAAHTTSSKIELDPDDDVTDDDDSAGHGQGEVEDVCLGCEGECVCGAAVAAPLLVPRAPIKVRITMSSLQASSAASTSHLPAPAPPAPAPAPAPSEWSEWSTVQKSRSFSEEHEAYEDRPKKKAASHKKKGTAPTTARPSKPKAPVDPLAPPRKRGRPRKDRSLDATTAPPRPPKAAVTAGSSTATPQRMSLRQVLAMSVRDAEIAEREQHSPAPPVFVPPPRFEKERLDDVSDLELELELDSSGSGSEGENAIEQAEERALREEFEREQRRDADDDDDASTVGQDLSEFDDEDEGRAALARKAKGDSTREGSSFELTSDVDQEDPEAFSGGRGVVTWCVLRTLLSQSQAH